MNKTNISFFVLGLLFGSGPCLVSCGPMLISYAAGRKKNLSAGLLFYSLFSLGRLFVYLGLSLGIFFLGRFSVENMISGVLLRYIFIIGGIFLILVGALLAIGKDLKSKSCQYLYGNFIERDRKSSLVLGLITGLLPCAPLLAGLSYLGLISTSWPIALFYALSFALGIFISPLALLTLLAGIIPSFLLKKNRFGERVFSSICGLIIVFLGLRLAWKGL
ncbi:MAG: sulfite exporter TauE/SafE family protein [Candidatus Omnitrophica bacterium]|nr:sulfite exporter TauE/SafE family protein [Candidatus Omnitrophota bacterium]